MTSPVTSRDVRPAAGLLKALSDENRLRMVALLSAGELCVCHIASALDLSQPNVSQHLTVLKNAGVVERERRGSWIYYRLPTELEPSLQRILTAVVASCQELASASEDRSRLSSAKLDLSCD